MTDSVSQTDFKIAGRYLAILISLSCLMAACQPSPGGQTSSSQQAQVTPSVTPTLYIMPTPPPSPTPICPGAPKEHLILQERGRVLPDDPRPINMRSAAGTDNTVLVQIPIRSLFYVLEGPVCADDFAWYKIRYKGREGWIAEGDLTSYYVEPYLPG